MKSPKLPFIALAFVLFFVSLLIVWLFRFDTHSDFSQFKSSSTDSSFVSQRPPPKPEVGAKADAIPQVEQSSTEKMSLEEQKFFYQLKYNLPSWEELDESCKSHFSGTHWQDYPVELAHQMNADHVGELAGHFFINFDISGDAPAPIFTHIADFSFNHESSNPEQIYQLLKKTSDTCMNDALVERLNNYIDQSASFGWSDMAIYKFSVLSERMLTLFQYIPTPQRMLLYINIMESLEQAGFLTIDAQGAMSDFKSRVEGLEARVTRDLADPQISNRQKNLILRDYLSELSLLAEQLTELSLTTIRRHAPASMPDHSIPFSIQK